MRFSRCWFAALLLLCTAAFAQDYDVLICNGRIVDGSDNPWFYGDVGIIRYRITFAGQAVPDANSLWLSSHWCGKNLEATKEFLFRIRNKIRICLNPSRCIAKLKTSYNQPAPSGRCRYCDGRTGAATCRSLFCAKESGSSRRRV